MSILWMVGSFNRSRLNRGRRIPYLSVGVLSYGIESNIASIGISLIRMCRAGMGREMAIRCQRRSVC